MDGISSLLDAVWDLLRGRGLSTIDFILVYSVLGGGIWALMLFKAFYTEGLNVASGEKPELHRILIKYLFVAAMFTLWPTVMADSVWNGVKALAVGFFPDMDGLFKSMFDTMNTLDAQEEALEVTGGLIERIVGAVYNTFVGNVLIILNYLVLTICYGLILINIAGSLTVLALNIVIGPVFFALAFDKDFRSVAIHWCTAILSYIILMPLYGAALRIAAGIAGAATPNEVVALPTSATFAAQVLGPILAVGIVFSANKVVNAIVGGGGGGGAGSAAMGIAAIAASKIPGGAVISATARGTMAAGGAIGSGAVTVGKGVGKTLSSAARAAIQRYRKP